MMPESLRIRESASALLACVGQLRAVCAHEVAVELAGAREPAFAVFARVEAVRVGRVFEHHVAHQREIAREAESAMLALEASTAFLVRIGIGIGISFATGIGIGISFVTGIGIGIERIGA